MFQTNLIRGSITVPRFTVKNKRDLYNCDDASNFANVLIRRYRDKGVRDVMVYADPNNDKMVEIHFTLVGYYPDKGNPKEKHWFHEMNLEQTLTNVHREFPNLSSLLDV